MLWLLDGPAPLRGNGRTRGATGTGFFLLDPIRSLSTFSCFAFRNGLRCSDVLRRYTAPMGGNERIRTSASRYGETGSSLSFVCLLPQTIRHACWIFDVGTRIIDEHFTVRHSDRA
jgi:hypothetical protein